jgi:hypothetical protein
LILDVFIVLSFAFEPWTLDKSLVAVVSDDDELYLLEPVRSILQTGHPRMLTT